MFTKKAHLFHKFLLSSGLWNIEPANFRLAMPLLVLASRALTNRQRFPFSVHDSATRIIGKRLWQGSLDG